MKITFEEEAGYTYAVAKDQEYELHGELFLCEELLYAEIDEWDKRFRIRWEDNWSGPETFYSLEDAKAHVQVNYELHKPHINGKRYKL